MFTIEKSKDYPIYLQLSTMNKEWFIPKVDRHWEEKQNISVLDWALKKEK